jgi:hypothetical protein
VATSHILELLIEELYDPVTIKLPVIIADPVNGKTVPAGMLVNPDPSPENAEADHLNLCHLMQL